jgi:hypothetical protein
MNKQFRKQAPEGGEGGGGGGGGNPPGGGGAPPPGGGASAFTFGDAHKDYVASKGWKGVDDVITSNKNLESLLGADKAGRGFIWPKDENDAEGHKALRAKLGVPEKADDYQLPLPAGATEPDAFLKAVTLEMHKLGVPKSIAQGLAKFVNDYDANAMKEAETTSKQQSEQALTELKTEWGSAHDANKGLAVSLMSEMGFTQEEITAMSGNAELLRKFHKGAAKLGTKQMAPGQSSGGGVDQATAIAQLEAARAERAAGKITEAAWMAISERLSPIAYPSKAA